jgi:hypothetical protein
MIATCSRLRGNVQIRHSSAGRKGFSILPLIVGSIGTPRISSALAIAAGRTGGYFDNNPFYGFVTTSAEALQQVRYALGLLEIPSEIAPFLSVKTELSTELSFELPHDLLIVEVPARRDIDFEGFHLNMRAISYYFQDRPRLAEALARFWGAEAARHRSAFLAHEPAFESADEYEKRLLTGATGAILTDDEIVLDLRRLHALVGNRLVIMTPILDDGAPESVKSQNSTLIAALESAAGQLGVPVFNPTAAFAEFVQEHARSDSKEDERHWWAAFDGYLADVIRRQFLEPVSRMKARLPTAPLESPQSAAPHSGFLVRWLSRKTERRSQIRGTGGRREERQSSETYALAVESAAWEGNWQYVLDSAREAPDLILGDPQLLESAAAAAWYLGHKDAALNLWHRRLEHGTVSAHRLAEAVELALQCQDSAAVSNWSRVAVAQEPQTASVVLRVLAVYDQRDAILDAIDVLISQGSNVLVAVDPLPSELKQVAVNRAAAHGAVDFNDPAGATILQQWLAELTAHQVAGRIEAVRETASRFDILGPSHPAYQSAQRSLVRALLGRSRSIESQASPDEVEAPLQEARRVDPLNKDVILALARLSLRRGDNLRAAQLIEELACFDEQPPSQIAAINHWLSAGEVGAAACALQRALRLLGNAETLALPRQRTCTFLAREIEKRQRAGDLDVVEDLKRYQRELCRHDEGAREATGSS